MAKVSRLTDREKILNNFVDRFDWIPHWGAEITSAVEGLEGQIEEAERFGGSGAVVSALAEANKYRVEALKERAALVVPRLESGGIYVVRHEVLHSDDVVIGAMARHLLFRDAHVRDKWPNHDDTTITRKSKPFVGTVKNLSNTKREGLWMTALASETKRELEWTGRLLIAHSNPNVASAIAGYNESRSAQAANAA